MYRCHIRASCHLCIRLGIVCRLARCTPRCHPCYYRSTHLRIDGHQAMCMFLVLWFYSPTTRRCTMSHRSSYRFRGRASCRRGTHLRTQSHRSIIPYHGHAANRPSIIPRSAHHSRGCRCLGHWPYHWPSYPRRHRRRCEWTFRSRVPDYPSNCPHNKHHRTKLGCQNRHGTHRSTGPYTVHQLSMCMSAFALV